MAEEKSEGSDSGIGFSPREQDFPTSEPHDEAYESADDGDLPQKDTPTRAAARRKNARRLDILQHDDIQEEIRAESGSQTSAFQSREAESEKIIDKARDYQQELFERAVDENVIAVLDTGTGKTLIAAMLIRHTLEQHVVEKAAGKASKFIFFLAHRYVIQRRLLQPLADLGTQCTSRQPTNPFPSQQSCSHCHTTLRWW